MDTTHKLQNDEIVVQWPEPAHLQLQQDQSVEAPCSIEFTNGERLAAWLTYFTGRDDYLVVKTSKRDSEVSHPFQFALSAIKQLQLTDAVDAQPYGNEAGEQAGLAGQTKTPFENLRPVQKQVYSVEFNGGEILSGETAGYVSMPNGIFLYFQSSGDRLQRVFIPKSAVASFHVGDPVGDLLVQEHAVSEDDLKHAVERQEALRRHLLGEYLLSEAYVTQDQLNRAMELQKTKPNLRLGEALIELGAFTSDALEAALARQRFDRSRPLGQILIEMGVLDQQTLQKIHDKKSGRPSVSLANFSIASDIRQKIPEAAARELDIVPLATEDNALIVACSATPDLAIQENLNRLAGMRVIAVIATPAEIRLKQNELYSSGAVEAGDSSSETDRSGVRNPNAWDASVAKLFESGEPIDLIEYVELPSERALLLVVQRILSAAIQGGVLDIHVESAAGKRHTNIRFRKGSEATTVPAPSSP